MIYSGDSATIITQTTSNGSFFVTAFGINDSGRVVGQGIDPNNAARNVGIVYDIGQNMAFEVGALPGLNGALAFGVSNTGYVVGSSMLNQGSGLAVHLVGPRRNSCHPARHRYERRVRARGELSRLGGGKRLVGVFDSVSL